MKYELRNSRIWVVCDVTNYADIYFFMLCRLVANNHNLIYIFFAESSCCHKMEFLKNSIRNVSYSVPYFIEWFIVKETKQNFITTFHISYVQNITNVKCCNKVLLFLLKTKKMIFLKVTMTKISENTSTKCLQCIAIQQLIKKVTHVKKCGFILIFSKNRSFCQSYPQIFTLMHIW